jgi:Holliday junction resolvase-like predicted endonuclease
VRVGRGELDLIATIAGERAAIEVKTSTGPSDPVHHLDDDKQGQVRGLAQQLGILRVDYVGVAMSATGVTVHWLPRVC